MSCSWRRRVVAPGAAVLLPAYLSACFHYVPAPADPGPLVGADIRATLVTPTPFNLGTVTVNGVTRLDGTVIDAARDSLGLWVRWLYPAASERYDANQAQFYVRRDNIQRLELWRISGKQTALLAAMAVGAFVGMLSLVSLAVSGGNSGTPPPPPPGASVSGPLIPH